MRYFNSSENIHKKRRKVGHTKVDSAKKKSLVSDPVIIRQQKPEKTYYNFANFK